MLYHFYEMRHAFTTPLRFPAEIMRNIFQNPANPAAATPAGRAFGAGAEMLARFTKRFTKPSFGLTETQINGKKVEVKEEIIAERSFCNLLNFKRSIKRNDPKILLVAPLSGHFATLLRDTVESLLPHHDIYITDWKDAREVPLSEGQFNMDDAIAYLHDFMSILGPETHVIAVCQPSYLVLSAISIMASERDPNQPTSMTLIGGPIDTRVSKTAVTEAIQSRSLSWFENNVIHTIPPYYPGTGRQVYPGFLQLSGFMSMNLDTHIGSHLDFFKHLVIGDRDSSEKHRAFYNEYLAVMDMPAAFYLQTVSEVYQKQSLPRGKMKWRNPKTNESIDIRPQDIRHTALLTIEGELDEISARGQTTAAHELCFSIAQRKQYQHLQLGCGHYGLFNGSRWRNEIMPRLRHFIRQFDKNADPIPEKDLQNIKDIAPERFERDKHGVVAVRRWLKEHRPENYTDCSLTQKCASDKKEPDSGYYFALEEDIETSTKKYEEVSGKRGQKKKPRVNKEAPSKKVQKQIPESVKIKTENNPETNVIEVSFSDKKENKEEKTAVSKTPTITKESASTKTKKTISETTSKAEKTKTKTPSKTKATKTAKKAKPQKTAKTKKPKSTTTKAQPKAKTKAKEKTRPTAKKQKA